MPGVGFKSITVSEDIYDKFYAKYENDKENYKEKGIFSFSAYITKILLDTKERDDFNDLKELLIVNNTTLLQMFELMLGGNKEAAQDGLLHLKMSMFEFIKELKGGNPKW